MRFIAPQKLLKKSSKMLKLVFITKYILGIDEM